MCGFIVYSLSFLSICHAFSGHSSVRGPKPTFRTRRWKTSDVTTMLLHHQLLEGGPTALQHQDLRRCSCTFPAARPKQLRLRAPSALPMWRARGRSVRGRYHTLERSVWSVDTHRREGQDIPSHHGRRCYIDTCLGAMSDTDADRQGASL